MTPRRDESGRLALHRGASVGVREHIECGGLTTFKSNRVSMSFACIVLNSYTPRAQVPRRASRYFTMFTWSHVQACLPRCVGVCSWFLPLAPMESVTGKTAPAYQANKADLVGAAVGQSGCRRVINLMSGGVCRRACRGTRRFAHMANVFVQPVSGHRQAQPSTHMLTH